MAALAPSTPPAPYSLKTRLLGFVLMAILLAALVQAATAYRGALQQADALFDDHLQQVARTLQRNVLPRGQSLGTETDQLFSADGFDLYVQIWGQDGTPLFRSRHSDLPPRAVLGFSDLQAGGKQLRVYSLQTALQTVQIAQDLSARSARAEALALRAVLPFLALTPLLMLAVWWVINQAMAPIERTRHQVARRAANDFSPLDDHGLPTEVRPLVDELNALFGRAHTAFEAQRHFVADAAHELRSPLTVLKLQAQALRGQDASSPTRQEDITRLNHGIDRAIRGVEQLLALAREEAGSLQPNGVVSLDALLQRAVADVLPQARHKQIDLGLADAPAESTAATDAAAPPVSCHATGQADALHTLLRNLLDNAIKYSPVGSQVDVSVTRDATHCTLSVQDSGPGIALADQARVFDRFYRASTASAEVGSGVGLVIVKVIADRHGASVTLSASASLGGLRVDVRLPRAVPAIGSDSSSGASQHP
jgi:two-component system OmpR family sensor kinase